MNTKALKSLEFDKIILMLEDQATNDITRGRINSIQIETDLSSAEYNIDLVSEGLDLLSRKQYPGTSMLHDVFASLKRAEIGGTLNTVELLHIARLLRITRSLISFYKDDKRMPINLDGLFGRLSAVKDLEDNIFNAIIDENEIADHASPTLSNIRRQITNTQGKVKELLSKLVHNQNTQKYLQDAIVTMRNGRYVVPVKQEHRGDVPGIVHDMSSTGSTLFIEPNAVVEANNSLRELEIKEAQEIERILSELTVFADGYREIIAENQRSITEIDFVFAKAKLAEKMKAIRPKLNDHGYVNLIKARHPMLDPKKVVPISISVGDDVRTMVITGPNTGGKTVTLKTVGLLCLMAGAGLLIPAFEGSEVCIFEEIYADIGDEQSIEQNLSTFSSHMVNIVSIINNINYRSLVLYDELGAGTDPVEGAALATAILEHSKKMGAVTMATTHYSELKIYALSTDGVQNAGCEFDINTLRPTYRLLVGTPGKSNAFAISKRLGLSDGIIDKASELLSDESVKFEDILQSIEENRQHTEREKDDAERYKQEIERLKKQLEVDKEKVEMQKEKLLLDARQEAKKLVQNAKAEVQLIIDEIKEAQKLSEKHKVNKAIEQAKSTLKNLDKPIIKENVDTGEPPKALVPGETVKLVDINQTGTAITKPDAKGMVQIQVGIMKISSHISNLRLVKEQPKSPQSYVKGRSGGLNLKAVKSELDLRGCTLDEASLLTDRFIDEAVMASLKEITLIHGKGTGALRAGLHKMLKTHHNVLEYRLGTFGEGDAGVTIVTISK